MVFEVFGFFWTFWGGLDGFWGGFWVEKEFVNDRDCSATLGGPLNGTFSLRCMILVTQPFY